MVALAEAAPCPEVSGSLDRRARLPRASRLRRAKPASERSSSHGAQSYLVQHVDEQTKPPMAVFQKAHSPVPALSVARALLVGRQLGRRDRLEPLVRDRLPALDREAVRPRREAGLGPLHGGELLTEILREARVELVLVETGGEARGIVEVGPLVVLVAPEPRERVLDPLALGRQQLTCPIPVHGVSLTAPSPPGIVRGRVIGGQASRTAMATAAARAAHLVVDGEPRIFDDTLAAPLPGDLADELVAPHRDRAEGETRASMRAAMTVGSRYCDDRLNTAAARGTGQCVLLGAGLDSLAYRSTVGGSVRVFEVDHPATRAWKRERLAAARIPVPDGVATCPSTSGATGFSTAWSTRGSTRRARPSSPGSASRST